MTHAVDPPPRAAATPWSPVSEAAPAGAGRDTKAGDRAASAASGSDKRVIIARTAGAVQQAPPARWQRALAGAVRSRSELLALVGLPTDGVDPSRSTPVTFPVRVPRGFVARMRVGDPDDPLLRQVLGQASEYTPVSGFVADPVGDLEAMTIPGMLQKYAGRVLLITTGACAVHCRYCFRRHFPYGDAAPALGAWDAALAHIEADQDIHEVILSGGDPLTLPDPRLAELTDRLGRIPHLRRLRLHTRLPVVLPERVDDALVGWLSRQRLKCVIVIHANHANEIDDAVREALARLAETGAALFNQSVLLRGVNDSADALVDLSEALFAAGVTPYYLHLLDRVAGAAHFEVEEARARVLMRALRARLPGYLVPRLVREQAGAAAKLPV